jgi:hypothetical protein
MSGFPDGDDWLAFTIIMIAVLALLIGFHFGLVPS